MEASGREWYCGSQACRCVPSRKSSEAKKNGKALPGHLAPPLLTSDYSEIWKNGNFFGIFQNFQMRFISSRNIYYFMQEDHSK